MQKTSPIGEDERWRKIDRRFHFFTSMFLPYTPESMGQEKFSYLTRIFILVCIGVSNLVRNYLILELSEELVDKDINERLSQRIEIVKMALQSFFVILM